MSAYPRIIRDAAHFGQSTDEGAFRANPYFVEPAQMGDVDDLFRLGHSAFGEIEQSRSAGEQHDGGLRRRVSRLLDRTSADIGKAPHDIVSAARRTAETMCG